ncbi:MAG: hypothetical protein ACYC3X_19965 [Pirellulaceae bacterium]
MEPKFHLGDDLNGLERVLRELAPAPARLDVAQTMFRAGQAAAQRPAGRPRLWQATSAALAVVSLSFGVLLAIPHQPRIVYVPRDDTAEQRQLVQPALVADTHGSDADNILAVSLKNGKTEITYSDARWLNPLNHLRSRSLAIDNPWATSLVTPETSQQATIPALCSGDWRTLADESSRPSQSGVSDSTSHYDWTQLLHIQGL